MEEGEELSRGMRNYYKNYEKRLEYQNKYHHEHREAILAQKKEYYQRVLKARRYHARYSKMPDHQKPRKAKPGPPRKVIKDPASNTPTPPPEEQGRCAQQPDQPTDSRLLVVRQLGPTTVSFD